MFDHVFKLRLCYDIEGHCLITVSGYEDKGDRDKRPGPLKKIGNRGANYIDRGMGLQSGPRIVIASPGRTDRVGGIDITALHEATA